MASRRAFAGRTTEILAAALAHRSLAMHTPAAAYATRPTASTQCTHHRIRIDGAGATHELLDWLLAQRLSYSVGFTLPTEAVALIEKIPSQVWTPAYDADGQIRDGAWVAELTGLLNLAGWPKGMRVIIRKERPHPGAQLRLTDADGNRITAFATNTGPGRSGSQLPDLELRHRHRARCEDRIRAAKDTGLTNLPLHDFDQNRIWCAIVALACDLTAWMQTLALTGHPARRWEPKRLRLRLLSIAGRLAATGRHTLLHLSAHAPWADLAITALTRLRTRPRPADQQHPVSQRPAKQPREWNPAPSPSDTGRFRHTPTPESASTTGPRARLLTADRRAKDPG